jgi:Kelch motif protein/galactose oxidase-like protein
MFYRVIALTTVSALFVLASLPAGPASGLATSTAVGVAGARMTAGHWERLPNMTQPRIEGVAVRLADGRVLVVGGHTADSWTTATASAEIFDPATKSWQAIQPMHQVRINPSVALLDDGRVLVTGGAAPTRAWRSSEIFDPATGAWTVVGRMHLSRQSASVVRLPDGRVLVFGGWPKKGTPYARRSAELFDPATGQWSMTGSLHEGRAGESAVLLPDGRVLADGGITCCGYAARKTTEIYDPASGKWSLAGDLVFARDATPSVLLHDGRVITSGGSFGICCPMRSAETYDPATGLCTRVADMIFVRTGEGMAVLPKGNVLVVDGGDDSGALESAEIYYPGVDTWRPAAAPPYAAFVPLTVALADGSVLIAGGTNHQQVFSDAALYVPGKG